jgi:hypothetical protein
MADVLHSEFPDGGEEHLVGWLRRHRGAGCAVLEKKPLEAAGRRDRQDVGDVRIDPVRVRHTARECERVAGAQPVRFLPDPDAHLTLKHDHLLILVGMHVQRQRGTARLFGFPNADATAAVGGGDADDDSRAGKPQRWSHGWTVRQTVRRGVIALREGSNRRGDAARSRVCLEAEAQPEDPRRLTRTSSADGGRDEAR